ncbi:hypothetical protein L6452_42057 [Arctium lappa]|uniref:Uncharacterized protein n=1 Tax=Arctium lappa TaxID=4217 RepID=A0ACB8XHL7_ARCLA|nr:hypothetical protein L6452_42057 [Arctium lappa]
MAYTTPAVAATFSFIEPVSRSCIPTPVESRPDLVSERKRQQRLKNLVGDYGFDSFGLGKPAEYLQFDLDSLDQNLSKNLTGDVIGTRFEGGDVKSTPFQPYTEVFGLQRFRECKLYTGGGLCWLHLVLVIGYIEFQRNAELDPEKRIYPGGPFDPLNLAADPEKKDTLQLAKIKHARLAMVAFPGFAIQVAATGKGPLNNWVTHLSDPLHTTILDTFGFFS